MVIGFRRQTKTYSTSRFIFGLFPVPYLRILLDNSYHFRLCYIRKWVFSHWSRKKCSFIFLKMFRLKSERSLSLSSVDSVCRTPNRNFKRVPMWAQLSVQKWKKSENFSWLAWDTVAYIGAAPGAPGSLFVRGWEAGMNRRGCNWGGGSGVTSVRPPRPAWPPAWNSSDGSGSKFLRGEGKINS